VISAVPQVSALCVKQIFPRPGYIASVLLVAFVFTGCRGKFPDPVVELETIGAKVEVMAEGVHMVDVRGKPAFTDEKIDLVTRVPRVVDLTMENVPVTDAGLERLRSASEIRRLILNESDVTGMGLRALADLPLRRGLSNIGLRGLKITDSDLLVVKQFPNLRRVDLSGTRITDAGLKHLEGMKLDVVNVKGTKVTEQGAARLQEASPGVKVTR
jgi:hypothetical protein